VFNVVLPKNLGYEKDHIAQPTSLIGKCLYIHLTKGWFQKTCLCSDNLHEVEKTKGGWYLQNQLMAEGLDREQVVLVMEGDGLLFESGLVGEAVVGLYQMSP
jgi:hypothetical protein